MLFFVAIIFLLGKCNKCSPRHALNSTEPIRDTKYISFENNRDNISVV